MLPLVNSAAIATAPIDTIHFISEPSNGRAQPETPSGSNEMPARRPDTSSKISIHTENTPIHGIIAMAQRVRRPARSIRLGFQRHI